MRFEGKRDTAPVGRLDELGPDLVKVASRRIELGRRSDLGAIAPGPDWHDGHCCAW